MTELQKDDIVRVRPMGRVGQIVAVHPRFKRWPYLVFVPGYGDKSFGLEDLEKLPPGTVLTLPPAGGVWP